MRESPAADRCRSGRIQDPKTRPLAIDDGDDDGNGDSGGNNGGGGDDDGEEEEEEEKEFGPLVKLDEVMKETERRGIALPEDMSEAAKSVGIRKLFLLRYLDLQTDCWIKVHIR